MSEWLNVSSVVPRIAYTATAGQTAFTVPFIFFENENLQVYRNGSLLALGSNYSVAGAEDEDGGSVTLATGATVGDQILIVRRMLIEQTTHVPPSGPLDIPAVNIQISKLIAIDQQLQNNTLRTLHLPDSDSTLSGELASQASRANKLLGFDGTGTIIYPLGPSFVGSTANGVAVVDSRATAAITTFDVSVNLVQTGGYAAPGDGGGGIYQRGTGGGSFTDGGGVSWVPIAVDDSINVKVFGAKGDGSTDDTAAIQAAITAYQGTGATIFLPRGAYKVSDPIVITGTLRLVGESRYGTAITWTNTTLYVLNISTAQQVFVERISFNGPASATAGNIITLDGPAPVGNSFSCIRDCGFNQGYNHVVTASASDWTVENCYFSEYMNYGVFVSDSLHHDAGDSFIGSCTLTTSKPNAVAILQVSSGGLKIVGNKIIGGVAGYQMQLDSAAGVNTVDLVMVGNSIEGQTQVCVNFTRPAGSLMFGGIVIAGNQFSGSGIPTSTSWVCIQTDTNAGWLSRLAITGNHILMGAGTGSPSFIGINIGSTDGFLIEGNQFAAEPNASGTTVGINISPGATNGTVGVNQFSAILGGTWTNKVVNAASSASVRVQQSVPQSGSASVTCSTANGALWVGTVGVTFPTAFDLPPKVTCTPGGVAAGVAAFPVSVTKTGFTLYCHSGINGGAGAATWEASGVL
ncbi:glycosyl hydrolase family 28-related protein [Bradyrhizobium ottawaense]|uniref:glycosyl hydrolase family 28-related protein n=1 Tax=Bradyrhizobium ottawaense TaxID=931866 RepID=UPI001178B637|nr:glycosyl hydrolase family 28-related protein [Bradyrhizobium ottawaense]